MSNAELAVSGGDERLRYRLSGTWFDQNGIVIQLGLPPGRRPAQPRLQPGRAGSPSAPSLAFSGDHDDRVENDGSEVGIITNAVGESPLVPVRGSHRRIHRTARRLWSIPTRSPWPTLNDVRARDQHPARQRRGAAPGHRPAVHFTSRFGIDARQPARGPIRVPPGGGTVRLERGRRGQERLHPGQPLRDRQLRHPVAQRGRSVTT